MSKLTIPVYLTYEELECIMVNVYYDSSDFERRLVERDLLSKVVQSATEFYKDDAKHIAEAIKNKLLRVDL